MSYVYGQGVLLALRSKKHLPVLHYQHIIPLFMAIFALTKVVHTVQAYPDTTISTSGSSMNQSYISLAGYSRPLSAPLETIETSTMYTWPTVTHRLSRGFSVDHSGLDIDGNTGDAIFSARPGVIEVVSSTGPYGNKIIVRHDEHTQTLYGHLNTIDVTAGQEVAAGQVIATMGSTGRSTGSHLHFETIIDGQLVDPFVVIQQ